jgi:hypothetical protein
MSGRGDNNKAGGSGRGASNQSGQGFGRNPDSRKANHGVQTGGSPSTTQQKSQDQSANRNTSLNKEKK